MLVKSLGKKPIYEGEEVDNLCYDKDEWGEVDLRLNILSKSLDNIIEKQNKITPTKLSNVVVKNGRISRRN